MFMLPILKQQIPWDISSNELLISQIPESIQISMKEINTTGMGDNLSITSIKRIHEINLKIAKAIAKASWCELENTKYS